MAPVMTELQEFLIDSLNASAEGVAHAMRDVAIHGALPEERVAAAFDGGRARLIDIIAPSAERAVPICSYFGVCGGCAAQHMSARLYADWKRSLLVEALAQAGVAAEVGALIDAHGEGRRRATFHARYDEPGSPGVLGFMRARTHDIIAIDACPVLAPGMARALDAARRTTHDLRGLAKPLDINITATLTGLDVDIRGAGPLDAPFVRKLVETAERSDLARLANHGAIIIERRAPEVSMGLARVCPPPGGFLQATVAGEAALASLALAGAKGAKRVADLFAGSGAIALRLAAQHNVSAFDLEAPALASLARAAGQTPALRPVTVAARDLFNRPLSSAELNVFDAVCFDPPRIGAQAQARELAASVVPAVIAISCNATSFARDARILIEGGYRIEEVTPIDQFRYSPHLEAVALFRRKRAVKRARRMLS
jgi:23S rRNA (uracil1939-C5)-methyltransferase